MEVHSLSPDARFKEAHVEFDLWAGDSQTIEEGHSPMSRPAAMGGRENKRMSDQEDSCGEDHAVLQPIPKGYGVQSELELDKASAKRIALFLNVSPPTHLAKWLAQQGVTVHTLQKFGA